MEKDRYEVEEDIIDFLIPKLSSYRDLIEFLYKSIEYRKKNDKGFSTDLIKEAYLMKDSDNLLLKEEEIINLKNKSLSYFRVRDLKYIIRALRAICQNKTDLINKSSLELVKEILNN